jgi:hypothetical protein
MLLYVLYQNIFNCLGQTPVFYVQFLLNNRYTPQYYLKTWIYAILSLNFMPSPAAPTLVAVQQSPVVHQ